LPAEQQHLKLPADTRKKASSLGFPPYATEPAPDEPYNVMR